VLPGVAALVPDVRLEVLMDDGTRLVVLHAPLGPAGDDGPGAIRQAVRRDRADRRERLELEVTNTSTRVVRVSSHYPFERVNRRLEFDRGKAAGHRLDIDAGSTERWAPGERRTVRLVRVR
jgi:urease subunit gamma/beta